MSEKNINVEKITLTKNLIEINAKKNLNKTLLLSLVGIIPIIFLIVAYIFAIKSFSVTTPGIVGVVILGLFVASIVLPFAYSIFSEIRLAMSNNNKIKEGKYALKTEKAIEKEYAKKENGKSTKNLMLTMQDEDNKTRKISAKASEYSETDVGDIHYSVFVDEQDYAFLSFSEKKYKKETNE